jgi:lysophospholipase L1-like esterase
MEEVNVPSLQPLSRRTKAGFGALLAALLVLAALAAEISLRFLAPSLQFTYASPMDARRGYGVTLGHRFVLNSLGMREREIPAAGARGERRILCLGDSITFGYGLSAEDAWPKALERRLRERDPGQTFFSINGSGNAATTHQALAFYRETARRFGARLVILGFCMNDVCLRGVRSDLSHATASAAASSLLAWRYELRRSYLFAGLDLAVGEGYKRYALPALGKTWLKAYPYQLNSLGMTSEAGQAWQDTLDSLGRLHQDVAADGAEFAVAAFPYQFQVSDDPRDNRYHIDKRQTRIDPFEKLHTYCDARGIPFVDLRAAFVAARREMLVGNRTWDDLFLDYCHPNKAGQQLAAERIADALAQREILTEAPSSKEDAVRTAMGPRWPRR